MRCLTHLRGAVIPPLLVVLLLSGQSAVAAYNAGLASELQARHGGPGGSGSSVVRGQPLPRQRRAGSKLPEGPCAAWRWAAPRTAELSGASAELSGIYQAELRSTAAVDGRATAGQVALPDRPLPTINWCSWLFVANIALAVLSVGILCVSGRYNLLQLSGGAAAQANLVREKPAAPLGLRSPYQISIFFSYVILSCTHTFLQRAAGSTGYSPVAATVLIYAAKTGMALAMKLWRGSGFDVPLLKALPLIMVPASCLAGYDVLSFLSLASLDPLTYRLVMQGRLFVVAILWQVAFGRRLSRMQWFALGLLACASVTKSIDKIEEVGTIARQGVAIAIIQLMLSASGGVAGEVLLKEYRVPTDTYNVMLNFQGFVAMLVVLCVSEGGIGALSSDLFGPEARRRLAGDPWMLASVVCLAGHGIVAAYFVRELSNVLKEISGAFGLVASATIEWGVLRSSASTGLGVESVLLAILALLAYNAEPLEVAKVPHAELSPSSQKACSDTKI